MGRKAKTEAEKSLENRKPNTVPGSDGFDADVVNIFDLPKPPPFLNSDAKKEWKRITPELATRGVLAKIDHGAIAACCQAYGRWVAAEKKLKKLGIDGLVEYTDKGYPVQTPYLQISNKALELYHKFMKEFGLTPASRRNVPEGKKPGKNPYEQWQQRKKEAEAKRKQKKQGSNR